MKRYIFLAALVCLTFATTLAQPQSKVPARYVHLKNGDIIPIVSDYAFTLATYGSKEDTPNPDAAEWNVRYIHDRDSVYSVFFARSFEGRGGIWQLGFARNPEDCVVGHFGSDGFYDPNGIYSDQIVALADGYMALVSPLRSSPMVYDPIRKVQLWAINVKDLTPGRTYYYRTYLPVESGYAVAEDGSQKDVVLYGPVLSFRIPRLWADFYKDSVKVEITDAQRTAFFEQHPDLDFGYYHYRLDHLLSNHVRNHWDEMMPLAVRSEQFDDAIVRFFRFEDVSENFYKEYLAYLDSQYVERSLPHGDDFCFVPQIDGKSTDFTADTSFVCTLVQNVDPKWGIPGNQYLEIKERYTSLNTQLSFDFEGLVAGRKYDIYIVTAPDTLQGTDGYTVKPTQARFNIFEPEANGNMSRKETRLTSDDGTRNFIIDGQELTTTCLARGYEVKGDKAYFQHHGYLTTKQRTTYTRTLRIVRIFFQPAEEE